MALNDNPDNSNVSKHLGKNSEYACIYDPSLLVREPRQSNRVHLELDDHNLPFLGYDTWNGYEVTTLTNSGLPVVCIAKVVYSCDSKYIVESKSMKLYFNSFSMTKLGDTVEEIRNALEETAAKDLSELLETDVRVRVCSNDYVLGDDTAPFKEWDHNEYITLETEYPTEGEVFDVYTETPELLEVIDSEIEEVSYHSALLRSRCRVTAQPDSGDVYIYMKGKRTVHPMSLLKYIVSFRDECHFHEEICEAIYKRLHDIVQPDQLVVRCLYARRGGWDINPERASDEHLLHYALSDHTISHVKTPKQ